MRIAFTILLNGKRHLLHNEYYKKVLDIFDKWIIVEGVASPGGSTSWCKHLPDTLHKNYLSNDGTTEFLDELKQNNDKLIVIRKKDAPWSSKDEQVNSAITEIKNITAKCFLWQIDIDEQWTKNDIVYAENCLTNNNAKTGCFLCNFFVGPNQLVCGEWGEGRYLPYRRLWKWEGENFKSHEPPVLEGKNGPGILIPVKFNHFSYFFEEDVKFKEKYYSSYDGLYERWLKVQKNSTTISIKELLGEKIWWSNTNTIIKYIDNAY